MTRFGVQEWITNDILVRDDAYHRSYVLPDAAFNGLRVAAARGIQSLYPPV